MIFSPNATVTELWVSKTKCKKTKPQTVAPRPYHSLSFRISGSVRFESEGEAFVSGVGCITFMPAGCGYVTEVTEDSTMYVVHFDTAEEYSALRPVCFGTDGDAELASLFSELCDAYRVDGDNRYRCMSVFYALLSAVDRPARHSLPRRMRLAKSYIDKNYNEQINIASLAYASGLSEVHFRNEFKKYFAMSPLAYVKKVRIDNARHLLRSGYCTVSDVAINCGFDSISYFSYEFRRATGVTPTEYKRQHHD